LNVRRYSKSDFEELARLYRTFFNEMREWQGWEILKLSQNEAKVTAKKSLDRDSWVFVAEDAAKLVGFARIQLWDGAYFVREVFVMKPFRRQNIGSRLLASCEDLVRRKEETSVYLSVEPRHSGSLRFLLRNGYDTLNTIELRKDLVQSALTERCGELGMLGHRFQLLKRNAR
jgi:GNAT superfamily N-acetyltransferase